VAVEETTILVCLKRAGCVGKSGNYWKW